MRLKIYPRLELPNLGGRQSLPLREFPCFLEARRAEDGKPLLIRVRFQLMDDSRNLFVKEPEASMRIYEATTEENRHRYLMPVANGLQRKVAAMSIVERDDQ